MKGEDGESLADLTMHLEEKKFLKFEFQYWDPYECCIVLRVACGSFFIPFCCCSYLSCHILLSPCFLVNPLTSIHVLLVLL
jgi:hypothetical protein